MNSERLKVILIEMLEEAGVQVLTHALAARPIMEAGRVAGCYFESKSGRQAILAKNTVDATGDSDIAFQAGADMVTHLGNCSLLFKIAGVNLDEFVEFLKKDPEGFPSGMDWVKDVHTFAENWYERGILFFPHYGGKKWRFLRQAIEAGEFTDKISPAFNLDVLGMYGLAGRGTVVINSNYYIFQTVDIREFARYELHAQKMCYYVADFLKRKAPGFGGSRVEHIGVDLGVRGSRYLKGRTTLTEAQVSDPTGPVHSDDVIGTMPMHAKEGDPQMFFKGYTFDVPFGITVPSGCTHLLVGSARAVSTEGGHKRLIRGMSGCFMVGQATGVAAALGAKSGISATDVPIRDTQRALAKQGVRLGTPERVKQLGLA